MGLLSYASTAFPQQVSFADNKGLYPYPVQQAYYYPVEYYMDLKIPQTYVTDQVKYSREILGHKLLEAKHYRDQLTPWIKLNSSVVPLDKASTWYKNLEAILQKMKDNINMLEA